MTITSYDPRRADVDPVPWSDHPMPAWVALLGPAAELAESLAATEFVPKEMRGRPAAIAAAILYGYEIGIGPMQALRSIDVVQGKPTPSAELLRALIYQAGHEVWVVEATGTRVTVGGRRHGQAREHTVTWTSEMARAAGLTGKDSWKKYPRQMLMARATSELARSIFPDAIHGLGALDDTADVPVVNTADTPIEAAANAATTMRRARKRTAPSTPVETPAHSEDAAPAEPSATPDGPPPSPPDNDGTAGAVTQDQLARINASFRDMDLTDRDFRLSVASAVARRRLTSSLEMTREEASALITALDDTATLGVPLPVWPEGDDGP